MGRASLIALMAFILAACYPSTPQDYEAAAAAMRRQTADALVAMDEQARYTAIAQGAQATATQIAADLQVSAARATAEMAVAAQMAHAAELDGLRATATAQVVHTEMAAQPTRYAATATAQAADAYHRDNITNGLSLLGGIAALVALGVLCWLLVAFGQYATVSLQAWAARNRIKAMLAGLVETSDGPKLLDPTTGRATAVNMPGAQDDPRPETPRASDLPSAPALPIKRSRTMGELEYFVSKAKRIAGDDADYIPRHDVMGMSGDAWTLRMDRLEEAGFIPKRQQGKRSTLYAKETLVQLLVKVANWERSIPPSPTGGLAENSA